MALNFITRRDYKLLKEIENYYNTQIDELPQKLWKIIRG